MTPPTTAAAVVSRLSGQARYEPGRAAPGAIKLSSNEDPFGPLPIAIAAAKRAVEETGRYPDHDASRLRAAIADHHGVDVENVTVGCGSVALLHQLAQAYAGPDDEVAFAWPSFIAYPQVTSLVGATAVRVDAMSARTRLVFVANPNNPTSTVVPTASLDELADRLPADCLLVLDEAYREYVTDPSVADGIDTFRGRANVCVLRTFSKAHALAGLRVGYLVGDPSVVRAVDAAFVAFSVNVAAQAAAIASLAEAETIASRARDVAAMRDELVIATRVRGIDVPDAHGNFVWLPVEDPVGLARSLEHDGVITRPLDGGVRVTVGLAGENEAFLAALDAALA